MNSPIRKIVTYSEHTFTEGGKTAATPLVMHGVAAVVTNPWAGRGFVDDLQPEIRAIAPDWRARVGNYQDFMSDEIRKHIKKIGLHVIGYRALAELM